MRSRHSERVIAATVAKRSRSLGARGTAISAQNLISVQDAIRLGAVAIRRCMTRPIHSAESRRRRMLCCHILAAWAVMSLSKLNCIHPEQIRRAPRLCRGPPRAPSRQNKQHQSLPHQRRPSMIPAPHLRRRRGERRRGQARHPEVQHRKSTTDLLWLLISVLAAVREESQRSAKTQVEE